MSFRQIFDRISRLARAGSFDGFGSSHDDELRRAQELIDEENRRDQARRAGRTEESAASVEDDNGMSFERACRILSVSADASEREITVAYRRKIVSIHPDRHARSSATDEAEAKARTQELNLAYAFLKRHSRG